MHSSPITPTDGPKMSGQFDIAADEYHAWFCAQVQAALDDPLPLIDHARVMAKMDSLLSELSANELQPTK